MPNIEHLGMGGSFYLAKYQNIPWENIIQDIFSFLTLEIIPWDGVFLSPTRQVD